MYISKDDFNNLQIIKKFQLELQYVKNHQQLELMRIKYLGKKGFIINKIKKIKFLELSHRKNYGEMMNILKKDIYNMIYKKKIELDNLNINNQVNAEKIDISLPGRRNISGSIHPITSCISYIESIFYPLGFKVINDGFEIEDSYHNFDALNIPPFHPARQIQDTFWFDSNRLLRTQTSNMQIHEIKKNKLPIKILVPGKVYRKDYDCTHSPMFHQIEGLVIDKNINFANLKWIIINFLNIFFNKKSKIRFRSSYFPFTVLSSEVDVMDEENSWLEVLGCGMVHPKILDRFDINPKIYSGFAFGLGIERMIMLYYGIHDLRLFLKNDLKFLQQFKRNRYF